MDENNDAPVKIKVVDRRRFTSEGAPRDDWEPAPEPARAEAAGEERPAQGAGGAPEPERPPEKRASGSASAVPPELFLELVATLAQQAEILLVGAPGVSKQPDQARRFIDYLAVLEERTRGNLTAEESQLLSNAIFQLRTLFVQKS